VAPILVGNDVVDLRDPKARSAAKSDRLVERVLCRRERSRLAHAPDPTAMLWTAFGAKEAAYKIVAKLLPGTIFAYKKFEVGPGLDEVCYEDLRLHLWIDANEDRVHAVACTRPCLHIAGVSVLPPDGEPGTAARELLKVTVAGKMGCVPGDLEIVREPRAGSWDGFGPPALLFRGEPIETDVSLSHDGGFVAFAAAGGMLLASGS
jgi:phosphopantetheinyl transferase (holo-ACP synthase)